MQINSMEKSTCGHFCEALPLLLRLPVIYRPGDCVRNRG